MKKLIAIILAVGLLGAVAPAPSYAGGGHRGGHGGFGAGLITGVIGLSILNALTTPYYAYPAPVYAPPPRAYYPPGEVWVPGHYESRLERRWIPGHWEFERGGYDRSDDDEYYDRGGHRHWIPGHYSDVEVRVWIPGHWEG